MIHPTRITNFDLNHLQLEEVILFWVSAAGKNAITASKILDKFLIYIHDKTSIHYYEPFMAIRKFGRENLSETMRSFGFGCYKNKSSTFWDLANSGLDLKTCSLEQLESIKGIGMKTSRCFLIHSRKNVNCAGLDVHILKMLRDIGYDVPKNTPSSRKKYLEIENIFLDLVKKSNKSVAEFDLQNWKNQSGRTNY